VVDGADGPSATPAVGLSLFQRPLRLATVEPGPPRGQSWHLFQPQALAPGLWQVDLVHSPAQGSWAFLSESWDRGWTAKVLGPPQGGAQERPVVECQGAFLAAALQGGEGTLEWRYRPPSLVLGLFLALLGSLFWGWAAWSRIPLFGR
ncbi:MAG TPA: hypothetical protein VK842_02780, partial [bacterium]|nr:hypothetical protein [bacterium]